MAAQVSKEVPQDEKQHTVQTKLTSLLPLSCCTYLHACNVRACCQKRGVGMYFTQPAFKTNEQCWTKNLMFPAGEPDDATPLNFTPLYQ